MQDTTTQAMTEVALGLSMAFFALLVLALISISLPNGDETQGIHSHKIPQDQLVQVNKEREDKPDSVAGQANEQSILLYWQGQYFTLQQELIEPRKVIQALNKEQSQNELVIAVSSSTDLHQLLAIQETFDGRDIKLTKLTKEWEIALSHKPFSVAAETVL